MTEQEWIASSDWIQLLRDIRSNTSDRKLRLFLCGICRHLTHLFFRPWSLTAVEVAELFIEGQATMSDLDRAEYDAESATFCYELDGVRFNHTDPYRKEVVPRLIEMGVLPHSAMEGGAWEGDPSTQKKLQSAAVLAEYCAVRSVQTALQSVWFRTNFACIDPPGRCLIDCIFGNPFREVAIDPASLGWRDGLVVKLAQKAYENREMPSGELHPQRLDAIADALVEAGCQTAEVIDHLRSPGPHVRGCWVIDRLLGKH